MLWMAATGVALLWMATTGVALLWMAATGVACMRDAVHVTLIIYHIWHM